MFKNYTFTFNATLNEADFIEIEEAIFDTIKYCLRDTLEMDRINELPCDICRDILTYALSTVNEKDANKKKI